MIGLLPFREISLPLTRRYRASHMFGVMFARDLYFGVSQDHIALIMSPGLGQQEVEIVSTVRQTLCLKREQRQLIRFAIASILSPGIGISAMGTVT
jgi:hypothetical protein